MIWETPPIAKVYEALGTIADYRLEIKGNKAKVYSSTKSKFYNIEYTSEKNEISCNDNASFYVGYLGYPAIAFLMQKSILPFNESFAKSLKGIPWKDLNQKNNNNFDKTVEDINYNLKQRRQPFEEIETFAKTVIAKIKELKLNKPAKLPTPPKGY